MDKRRRIIEFGKDILIVLLTCSALWLAWRNQLLGPISRMIRGNQTPQSTTLGSQSVGPTDTARPLRMAVCLAGTSQEGVYGVLSDTEATNTLYDSIAGVLSEALSGSGQAEKISREVWERILTEDTGVLMDFQGEIPLSVLAGWLSGTPMDLDTPVRRLALAVENSQVILAYPDGDTYSCIRSEVANPAHLISALDEPSWDGAFYAFQSDAYAQLESDTLLPVDTPRPAVCAAANPMGAGQSSLEELLEDLSIPVNANGIYRGADDEWVARSGFGTLRLSDRGFVVFESGEEVQDLFRVSGGDQTSLYEKVEICRSIASAAMTDRTGQARLYLMDIRQTDTALEVTFGLAVDGLPVITESGSAARFLISDTAVERFEIGFRSYTPQEETTVVMPPRQAAAAVRQPGAEMTLIYRDTGAERVEAEWAAFRSADQTG